MFIGNCRPLMDTTFTVQRTSGTIEKGWYIPRECFTASWIGGPFALKKDGQWRINMRNDTSDPLLFACGWRRVDTLGLAELQGDVKAIVKWRQDIVRQLERHSQRAMARMN